MRRYSFVLFFIVYFTVAESACPVPAKYYIECGNTSTLSNSLNICHLHGMTLVNLTNSSSLTADITLLNQTLNLANCTGNFWFASGNGSGYIANVDSLGGVLSGLLAGTLNLVLGIVADLLSCLLILCAFTTTPAPITQAVTVCTRPIQQQVIQKCQIASVRTDMRTFTFTAQPMYGGILDSFPSQSQTTCSGLCSNNNLCIGISYINNICSLYM